MRISRLVAVIGIFLCCPFCFLTIAADHAFGQAILRFIPDTGSYQIGQNIDVDILVDTGGQNVVAVAAFIKYDPSYFMAISIDTSGSVFTIGAQNTIDTNSGDIGIVRGSVTPGVNTSNGHIARVNLTALSPVSPANDNFIFKFTPGSSSESCVIIDDGLGTNILSSVYDARFFVSGGSLLPGDFAGDCDVDGSDLAALIANAALLDITTFAQNFGKNVCP